MCCGFGSIWDEIAHFQVNINLLGTSFDWSRNAFELNRSKIQGEGALLALDAITITVQKCQSH